MKIAANDRTVGQNASHALLVAEALNVVLADLFALYLKTKNFHWHMSGPHFRDYHLMLDAHGEQIIGITDAVAERVRKTGNLTLHSIGDIARKQRVVDSDAVAVAPVDMLAELHADNVLLIDGFRQAKALADEAKDNATSAFIDEWTDQAEERAWFLYETIR